MRKNLLTIWLFSASFILHAQTVKKDTVLNEVIISGTRSAKDVFSVSRSAEVITRDQIEKTAFNTVGELLSNETSIYLVGAGQNPGSNQSIFMRGSNSNHVNVLIDGVKITDPSSPNSAIDFSEISVANVERIEIIKGSHGALYGTGGIGGVINIITRKSSEGLSGTISSQVGALGDGGLTTNQSAFLNYGKKGFYINGSIFNTQINGIDATQDTTSAQSFLPSDEDNFSKTDYSIKAGYNKNGLDIYGSYKKVNQQADIDKGAFVDDDNYTLDFDRELFQYGLEYQFNNRLIATYQGGFSESKRVSIDDSSRVSLSEFDQTFVSSETDGILNTNEIQIKYNNNAFSAILGGGSYKEQMDLYTYFYSDGPFGEFESINDYDSVDMSLASKYVFASFDINVGEYASSLDRLYLTANIRYTSLDNNTENISFDINPSYQLNNSLIYLSYSQGFNRPSLTQLYSPNGVFNFTTRGNENLEAETSSTLELGLKQKLNGKGYLTLSVFNTQVNNAIEYVYLWNSNTQVADLGFIDYLGDTFINIAEQNIKGLEIEGEYFILPKLKLKASGSWLDTEFVSSSDDLDTDYTGDNHVQLYSTGSFLTDKEEKSELIRRPSYQFFSAVNYLINSKLFIQANLNLINSRQDVAYDGSLGPFGALGTNEIDEYFLVGLNATYQFNENLFTTMSIENLTDEDYNEIAGFNSRGRSFYLKVGYRF